MALDRLRDSAPQPYISEALERWLHGDSGIYQPRGTVPEFLRWEDAQRDRGAWGDAVSAQDLRPVERKFVQVIADDLDGYARRTLVTKGLAAKFWQVRKSNSRQYVGESLARCHHEGTHGVMVRGDKQSPVVAWDHKCGMAKVCPHCARIEARRLGERYIGPITKWLEGGKRRRAFYMVLTIPTVKTGGLKAGIEQVWRKWSRLMDRAKNGKGLSHLKGALVTLECHLTAKGEWHPHLNVLALVEGQWDYERVWEEWQAPVKVRGEVVAGGMPYIQPIKAEGLASSLRELVKYVAKQQGGADGKPGIAQWSHDDLVEWWRALERTRRVRSYGCLFDLKDEPEEDSEGSESSFHPTGRTWFEGGRYVLTFVRPNVDLILEDKSGKRWRRSRPPPRSGVENPPGLPEAVTPSRARSERSDPLTATQK